MKKFRLIMIAALAILACTGLFACTDSEEIMKDYIDIISQEAETDEALQEILAEAEEYIAANISKLEKEDADYMFYLLRKICSFLMRLSSKSYGWLFVETFAIHFPFT